jgi:hypothetical protein
MRSVMKPGVDAGYGLRGKIPSSAQENMSRDTESIIAGRSLVKAMAAPNTISTAQPEGYEVA